MKVRVKWVENALFIGESGSGHSVVMDGPPEGGGRDLGIRPMEMLLLGTGGCSAYDVVSILKKSRQPISDCVVEISAQRADAVPAVFTSIHLHFIISGRGLSDAAVKRAVQLTAEKYCSASIMLAQVVDLSHDYQVIELGSND